MMNKFKPRTIKINSNISRLILHIFVVIAPLLISMFLVNHFFDLSLNDFRASSYFNDEIDYWHMAKTFKEVGFKGGYYTLNEMPASIKFIHFGPHGPMYPIIYGFIGKAIHWEQYTPVLINIGLISISLVVFIYITKINNRRLGILVVLLSTFWPMLLYIPSNTQQSLHQSFAILFAGLFYKLLSSNKPSRRLIFVLFGLIFFASLVHFSWAILFFPFFFIRIKFFSLGTVLSAIIKSTALVFVFFIMFQFMAAKYPYGFLFGLFSFFGNQVSLIAALKGLVKGILLQIDKNLIVFTDLHLDLESLSGLLRIQVLFIISLFGIKIIKKQKNKKDYWERRVLNVGLFHLFLIHPS